MSDYWTNPLTGSDTVPTTPGELITAAIAYWEDQLTEARNRKYLRKPADKEARQRMIDTSTQRLMRYTGERVGMTKRKPNRVTMSLAVSDLEKVMRVASERAA